MLSPKIKDIRNTIQTEENVFVYLRIYTYTHIQFYVTKINEGRWYGLKRSGKYMEWLRGRKGKGEMLYLC